MHGGHSRDDMLVPPFISIVWSPGRPGIPVVEGPEASYLTREPGESLDFPFCCPFLRSTHSFRVLHVPFLRMGKQMMSRQEQIFPENSLLEGCLAHFHRGGILSFSI